MGSGIVDNVEGHELLEKVVKHVLGSHHVVGVTHEVALQVITIPLIKSRHQVPVARVVSCFHIRQAFRNCSIRFIVIVWLQR